MNSLPIILSKSSIVVLETTKIDKSKVRVHSGNSNSLVNYLNKKRNTATAFKLVEKLNLEENKVIYLEVLTPSFQGVFEMPIDQLNNSFISVLFDPNNPAFLYNIMEKNIDLDDTLLNPLVKTLDLDVKDLEYTPQITQEDEPDYDTLFQEYQILLVKYSNLKTIFDLLGKSNIPMIENDYFKELLANYLKGN